MAPKHFRIGNGDTCPTDPEHGPMVVLQSQKQFCPHVDHDGRPSTHSEGPAERTRSVWPLYMEATA